MRQRREVVDHVGLGVGDARPEATRVSDVGLEVGADDVIVARPKVIDQVRTDEAGGTGDEGPHPGDPTGLPILHWMFRRRPPEPEPEVVAPSIPDDEFVRGSYVAVLGREADPT